MEFQLKLVKMQKPPVFIIDDDKEELDIIQELWTELSFDYPLEVFDDVGRLITKLQDKVNPFLIIRSQLAESGRLQPEANPC